MPSDAASTVWRHRTPRSTALVLCGQELTHRYRREANDLARRLFEQAAAKDPRYGRSYAGMARTFNLAWRYRWDSDPEACLNRSVELALRALECDDLDPHAHATLGYAYLFRKDHAAALAAYERAAKLNPNDPDILAEYS